MNLVCTMLPSEINVSCCTISETAAFLSEPCTPAKQPLCPPPENSPRFSSREERAMNFLDTEHLLLSDPRDKEYTYYESRKAKVRSNFRSKTVILENGNNSDWLIHKSSSLHEKGIDEDCSEDNEVILSLEDIKTKKRKKNQIK